MTPSLPWSPLVLLPLQQLRRLPEARLRRVLTASPPCPLFCCSLCSVAQIAKARLRRVLSSDRVAVNPALKNQLCNNIVNSMAEFVILNKEKEVQFAVHRSPDTGSVYMVKVPVRASSPTCSSTSRSRTPEKRENKRGGAGTQWVRGHARAPLGCPALRLRTSRQWL